MKYVPELSILKYPDPRLLQRAEEVQPEDFKECVDLAHEMMPVLERSNGWGLAAPQVGVPWRMFLLYYPRAMRGPITIINPKILKAGEVNVMLTEGCLSFPGERNGVWRPGVVHVEYRTSENKVFQVRFDGWPARIFQHEFEHLEGGTMIDHWLPSARKKLLKRLGIKPATHNP